MDIISSSLAFLVQGLGVTAALWACSIMIGFHLGLGMAVLRLSSNRTLSAFAKYYSVVFRGIPLIVLMFLFYYGLGQVSLIRHTPVLWWIIGNGFRCAVVALTLNTAAYTSEILRGGLMSVPPGLIEAARASGMSSALAFRRIVFPLGMRQALAAYGNELILVMKGTSLASTITVLEITGYAKRLMGQTFAVLEIFAAAGALYLLLDAVLITGLKFTERRLNRHIL